MTPSQEAGNRSQECYQGGTADEKQPGSGTSKPKKETTTATTARGASVTCTVETSTSVTRKKTTPVLEQSEKVVEKTLPRRDTRKWKGDSEQRLSLDEKRFRVPKHSSSEQKRVTGRGKRSEKVKMAAKEMKTVAMTLQLDDLVVRARELDQKMKNCKASGEKLPLQKKPRLKAQALQLIKNYEQYLCENPDEAQSLAVLKRQVIQFHTGKHQIIRLSICHLKSQMLPMAEALAEDMGASLERIDVKSMAPFIKNYLNPYRLSVKPRTLSAGM
ncbi:MAG: hypothetical protein ACR2PX_10610 [Endozoicomonas sp.]|uniref:hypothetical protein n=1 Tax=Endozoicomonas sp. TaxID=1892382 RepID=UPI003D9BB69F